MVCKSCRSVMRVPRGKDYICGGIRNRGTKYKGDKIKLCLRGKLITGGESSLETTPMEANIIASILSACASHFAEH